MKSLIIVGGTGRGKTTFIKTKILNKVSNPIIYDINGEYYNERKELLDIEEFLDRLEQTRNKTFVFEEATSFFDHSSKVSRQMKRILTRKRHRKHTLIFVFHALHQVPVNILSHIDLYVLFKTDENPTLVESKFRKHERIIKPYWRVYKHPDPHYKEIF